VLFFWDAVQVSWPDQRSGKHTGSEAEGKFAAEMTSNDRGIRRLILSEDDIDVHS
jgi:hypothetical protein